MKIAHIIYDSPANPWVAGGGAARNVEIYTRFRSCFQVDILSGDYKGAIERHYNPTVRQMFLGAKVSSYPLSRFFFSLAAQRFVRKRKDDYDLFVEDYSPFSPAHAALLLPRNKFICQTQNYFGLVNHLRKLGPAGFITSLAEKNYYRMCGSIIFSSRDLADIIASETGVATNGSGRAIIPYGVSDDILKNRKILRKKQQILFLGRLEIHQKGLDALFFYLRSLTFGRTGLTLVIAGSGKDEKKVLRLVEHNRLSRCVRFAGRVEGEEKTRLIGESLFTVIPSRYESWGIVSLESQACGTPVLAADIPGLRQTLIPDQTGILFRDFTSFKAAFSELCNNRKKRGLMSAEGMKFARQFSWNRLANIQRSFYQSIRKGS